MVEKGFQQAKYTPKALVISTSTSDFLNSLKIDDTRDGRGPEVIPDTKGDKIPVQGISRGTGQSVTDYERPVRKQQSAVHELMDTQSRAGLRCGHALPPDHKARQPLEPLVQYFPHRRQVIFGASTTSSQANSQNIRRYRKHNH